MWVVGLFRSGAEPEVVVKVVRDGLRGQVGPTGPAVQLPVEPRCRPHRDRQRPAEKACLDGLAHGSHGHTQSVKPAFEAEPGIDPEDAIRLMHGIDHGHPFTDCSAHGLFAPDVFASLGGFNRHQGMPMGRRCDVHDINVVPCNEFAKVVVGAHVRLSPSGCLSLALLEMVRVHIAERQQFAGHRQVLVRDDATADDAFGQLFTWRGMARTAQNMPRHNLDRGQCTESLKCLTA